MLQVFFQQAIVNVRNVNKFKSIPGREYFLFSNMRASRRSGNSGFDDKLGASSRESKRKFNRSSDRVRDMVFNEYAAPT
jgi:hypothetical protein